MEFDPIDKTLLTKVLRRGKLVFINHITGEEFPSRDEDTLFIERDPEKIQSGKFRDMIRVIPYEAINTLKEYPCPKCSRQVTSYIRLGNKKDLYRGCICGHIFN